jgi:hypothetical protein
VDGATEHRSTGGRAWCFQDSTWCRKDALCACCHIASEQWEVWLPKLDTDDYSVLVRELRAETSVHSFAIGEVLRALWERRE